MFCTRDHCIRRALLSAAIAYIVDALHWWVTLRHLPIAALPLLSLSLMHLLAGVTTVATWHVDGDRVNFSGSIALYQLTFMAAIMISDLLAGRYLLKPSTTRVLLRPLRQLKLLELLHVQHVLVLCHDTILCRQLRPEHHYSGESYVRNVAELAYHFDFDSTRALLDLYFSFFAASTQHHYDYGRILGSTWRNRKGKR